MWGMRRGIYTHGERVSQKMSQRECKCYKLDGLLPRRDEGTGQTGQPVTLAKF
jgi:hypothetical protein